MANKIDYDTTNLSLFSVRYALSRNTSASWEVIRALKAKWAEIDPRIQERILREVSHFLINTSSSAPQQTRGEWADFWNQAEPGQASVLSADAFASLFGIISNDSVNSPWKYIPTVSGALSWGAVDSGDFISADGYLDELVSLGWVEYEDIDKDGYDLIRATPSGIQAFQALSVSVKADCVERWVNHPDVRLFMSLPSHHENHEMISILLTAAELGDGEDMLSVYGISHEN